MLHSYDGGPNGSLLRSSTAEKGYKVSAEDRMLLNSAIKAYNPSFDTFITPDLVEALTTGARVVSATPFWNVMKRYGRSVVDLAAGVGSEMMFAKDVGFRTVSWDPDKNCRLISQRTPFLHSSLEHLPVGNFDITFIDWDWNEAYDKASKTLDMSDFVFMNTLREKSRSYASEFLIMKTPRNIKTKFLTMAVHVVPPNSNTGYIIRSNTSVTELHPIIQDFDALGWSWQITDVNSLDYYEQCLRYPKDMKHYSSVKATTPEDYDPKLNVPPPHRLKPDEGLGRFEILNSTAEMENKSSGVLEGTSFIVEPSIVHDNEDDFDGFLNELGVVKTSLSSDLLSSLKALFDYAKNVFPSFAELIKLGKDILRDFGVRTSPVSDELPEEFKDKDFTSHPVVHKVLGNEQGTGYYHKGSFVTAWHVTKGKDMTFGKVKVRPSYENIIDDIVVYGGGKPNFYKTSIGKQVFVFNDGMSIAGTTICEKPVQFQFPGAPVAGLSGSPIYNSNFEVLGLYSNHIPHAGYYVTIPTSSDWANLIADKLEDKKALNVYVPCGHGKSTYLPKVIADRGNRVLLICPRMALPREIAKRLGSKARGFSGDDEIQDHDCEILVITHGKFVNAIINNPTRFSSYNVVLVDEAHDNTALTRATIEWISANWTEKAILMTGSPHIPSFTDLAVKMSKFPVKKIMHESTKDLTPAEVFNILNTHYRVKGNVLVQVPTSKFASDVIKFANSQRCEILSRATIDKKGFQYFVDKCNTSGNVWLFATPVVNFGFTLPVDSIIIQGSTIDNQAPIGQLSHLSKRVLTKSELTQWLGRVGRIREGVAHVPKINWSQPVLESAEMNLLIAYRILLNLTSSRKIGSLEVTVPQVKTALKLDMALSEALGLVDETGCVMTVNDSLRNSLASDNIPVVDKRVEIETYSMGKRSFVGPKSGLDLTSKINKELGYGLVRTGFMSWVFMIGASYLTHFFFNDIKLDEGKDVSEINLTKKFKKNVKTCRSAVSQPGILITEYDQNLCEDVVILDTIRTSFSINFDVSAWLRLWFPNLFSRSYRDATVRHGFTNAKVAQNIAYFLGAHGINDVIRIEGDDPDILLSEDEISCGAISSKTEQVLCEKYGKESVSTSFFWNPFPSLVGFIFGPIAVVLVLFLSWLTFGSVPVVFKNTQKKFKNALSASTFESFKNSFGGVVIPTSLMALMSVFNPLGWLVILSGFKRFKFNLQLSRINFPMSVSTGLPSWIVNCHPLIKFIFTGYAAPTTLYKVHKFVISKVIPAWSPVNRMSGFYKILTSLGLYAPATIMGVFFYDFIEAFLVFFITMFFAFGPTFPNWTLVYPLFIVLMGLTSWIIDYRYIDLVMYMALVYFSRLQINDLRYMWKKGVFENFTDRDPDVRIVNNVLYKRFTNYVSSFIPIPESSIKEVIKEKCSNSFAYFRKLTFKPRHSMSEEEAEIVLTTSINYRKLLKLPLSVFFAYQLFSAPSNALSRILVSILAWLSCVVLSDDVGKNFLHFASFQSYILDPFCALLSFSFGTFFKEAYERPFNVEVLTVVQMISALYHKSILGVLSLFLTYNPRTYFGLTFGGLSTLYYLASGDFTFFINYLRSWEMASGRYTCEEEKDEVPDISLVPYDSLSDTLYRFTNMELSCIWLFMQSSLKMMKRSYDALCIHLSRGAVLKKYGEVCRRFGLISTSFYKTDFYNRILTQAMVLTSILTMKTAKVLKRFKPLISRKVIKDHRFPMSKYRFYIAIALLVGFAVIGYYRAKIPPVASENSDNLYDEELFQPLETSISLSLADKIVCSAKLLYASLVAQILMILFPSPRLLIDLSRVYYLLFLIIALVLLLIVIVLDSRFQLMSVVNMFLTKMIEKIRVYADKTYTNVFKTKTMSIYPELKKEIASLMRGIEISNNTVIPDCPESDTIPTSCADFHWAATSKQPRDQVKKFVNRLLATSSWRLFWRVAMSTGWCYVLFSACCLLPIAFSLHNVLGYIVFVHYLCFLLSLLIFSSRFAGSQIPTFDKSFTKLVKHIIYDKKPILQSRVKNWNFTVPKVPTDVCLVVGIAGDTLWLERALGLYLSSVKYIPNLSMLLICDDKLHREFSTMDLCSNIVSMRVPIEKPSEMRSARMYPMFKGDPNVYYLHRDADWRFTPLEIESVKLRTNLFNNPLGISPSPVLMASVNYWGGSFNDLFPFWMNTKEYWKTYGHDERVAAMMTLDHVYNKLSPLEQNLFKCSAVQCQVPCTRLIIPSISFHCSKVNQKDFYWKTVSLKSYGTNEWIDKVHNLSASSNTYCSRQSSFEVIKTGLINDFFYSAFVWQVFAHDLLQETFFDFGKKLFYQGMTRPISSSLASLVSSCFGSLYGVYSGVKASCQETTCALQILNADVMARDGAPAWIAAQRSRGLDEKLAVSTHSRSVHQLLWWSATIANPLAIITYHVMRSLFPYLSEIDLLAACVTGCRGTVFALIYAVFRLYASLIRQRSKDLYYWNVLSTLSTVVQTGQVKWWAWYPSPHVTFSYEIPYLGLSDSEVLKTIQPYKFSRGWVTGWGNRKDMPVTLPPTMINLRASTMIALSRYNFFSKNQIKTVGVFGSGAGGCAQGIMHERIGKEITLYTLPEIGFVTEPMISDLARASGYKLTDIREDFRGCNENFDLLVLDIARPIDDPMWWSDDFSHRDDINNYERQSLEFAIHKVNKGGTLITSTGFDTFFRVDEIACFLSLHFAKVTIVEDPLKRKFGYVWFVAEKKLHRKSEGILMLTQGNYHHVTEETKDHHTDFFTYASQSLSFMNQGLDINSFWQSRLFQIFRPFNTDDNKVSPVIENKIPLDSKISPDSADYVNQSPILYQNTLSDFIKKFSFMQVPPKDSNNAFTVLGRSTNPPVPDREFNAGVNLFAQALLAETGVLPLNKTFDVPSQSNFMVYQGLFKRYAFEELLPPVARLDSVITVLYNKTSSKASLYDFTPPSWDELYMEVTKKSSLGYMKSIPAANIGHAIRNFADDLDMTYYTLLSGGKLNLGFHASPKVEKKETSSLMIESVPRLFLYKEGAVRLCTVRLFKKFNDFMATNSLWFSAMSGDIFDKSLQIISSFEKFREPAACPMEAQKWDGHLPAELYVKQRMLAGALLRLGKGGLDASRVLQSLSLYDVWGHIFMCDGTLVEFQRGFKSSGEPDTSYGNKIANDIIGIDLVSQSLNISPKEAFELLDQFTEGDDKVIIGEIEAIVPVCRDRNKVYLDYGIPQDGEAHPIRHPEYLTFCSHGYTKLSNGICVPIRDLHEVFGRLLIPTANGMFTLDFAMAARCLTSVISLAATFWYLPEVRRFYTVISEVIPKDVLPAAISREERWKFYYNLGIINPTRFKLEDFVLCRFGQKGFDGITNQRADEILNIKDFRSLRDLRSPFVLERIRSLLDKSTEVFDQTIWYEELLTLEEISCDLAFFAGKGLNVQVFCQTPVQLRSQFLRGETNIVSAGFGSFKSALSRCKTDSIQLVFSRQLASLRQYAISSVTSARAKFYGFRGKRVVICSLQEDDYKIHKVVNTSSPRFYMNLLSCSLVALILLWLYMSRESNVIKTSVRVAKGQYIYSNDATVVTGPSPVRSTILQIKNKPQAQAILGLPRALAHFNLFKKKDLISATRNTALSTLSVLLKTCRRVGVLIYDDNGDLTAYLLYFSKGDERISSQKWADKKIISDLIGKNVDDILDPSEWRANGAMLTVERWAGEYQYGQFERPMNLFRDLQGKISSVVLFCRISDAPALRKDGFDSNSYLYKGLYIGRLAKYGLVIGESSGPDFVDIAKPYDAEILYEDSSVSVLWSDKSDIAVFRGGTTGAGGSFKNNTRHLLVEKEHDISSLAEYTCDFKFTTVSERVTRTLDGELVFKNRKDFKLYPKKSYLQLGLCKIIVVPEGNEAPDRTLLCFLTGSLVIYVRPTYCLSGESWFDYLLKDRFSCLIVEPEVTSLSAAIKWVKNNDKEASKIASAGLKIAMSLVNRDSQVSYMCNLIESVISFQSSNETTVSSQLQWATEMRLQHSLYLRDLKHHYIHGSGQDTHAATFKVEMMSDVDVGCGVSLFIANEDTVLNFYSYANKLKRGRDRFATVSHLSGSELSRIKTLFSMMNKEDKAPEFSKSIGTLGGGNHFVELVASDRFYLMVHSGSRGAASALLSDLQPGANFVDPSIPYQMSNVCCELASLNRLVIARQFKCHELHYDCHHTKVLSNKQCTQLKLENNWFFKDLMFSDAQHEILLLSSPGTGAAMLTHPVGLVPHGMGGKGGRWRSLSNIRPDKMLRTIMHVSNNFVNRLGFSSPKVDSIVSTSISFKSLNGLFNSWKCMVLKSLEVFSAHAFKRTVDNESTA